MSRLPKVHREVLGNAASPDTVERVWQRLENQPLSPRRPVARGLSVLALASVAFALGLWVGMSADGARKTERPEVAAEPPVGLAPAGATAPEEAGRLSAQPAPPATVRTRARPSFSRHRSGFHDAEPAAPVESPVVSDAPARGQPTTEWLRLANLGQYGEAWAALESEGGFDAALLGAPAERLMALADIARANGHRGRALQALRTVLDQFSSSPEAPLAAWTLGNMLEQAGDQVGAASAFAWYQRLSPRGDFAEDAIARQLEALIEQKNVGEARRLAKTYEAEFPESQRLRELLVELARIEEPEVDSASSSPAKPFESSPKAATESAPSPSVSDEP